ncbi:MAG: DUF4333 domain-containing protein [Micrococcales bacterium]|nr:DUF4333 domain-containing protein [Micrococcales bacterium]
MRSSLIALGAGAILVTTALSGCSGSVSVGGSNLDIDGWRRSPRCGNELNLSGTPTVTCPDPVPIEQGNVFTCSAELDGDSIDVEVTQTDDKATSRGRRWMRERRRASSHRLDA